MKRSRVLATAALVTAVAACFLVGRAACSPTIQFGGDGNFQNQPFTGQGGYPDTPKDIYVSAMLQRLIGVDDKNYRFESIMYVYLSWEDGKALSAVDDATLEFRNGTKAECQRPCASDFVLLQKKSSSTQLQTLCCDYLWLPTIRLMNVYELPDTRLQSYEISVEGTSVSWWTAINCHYFTPMNFRRFPFDRQELVMQFGYASTDYIKAFHASTTSTRFLIRGDGNIVSGWNVDAVVVSPYVVTEEELYDWVDEGLEGTSTFNESNYASDPRPPRQKNAATTNDGRRDGEGGKSGTDDAASYDVDEFSTFEITINIRRIWKYYVLHLIIPVLLILTLSLITYMIPVELIDVRIGLGLSLFLSLTALQFIINESLPKSSTPTAMHELILISYVIVTFGLPVSILTFMVSKAHQKENTLVSEVEEEEMGCLPRFVLLLKRARKGGIPYQLDRACFLGCLLATIIALVALF